MKLTKEKLYQLIIEQMRPRQASMDREVFQKRRQYPKGGTIRAFGDENQPTNRPELQDKLTTLASSGPEGYNQALDLADTIDEPLDIEFDPTGMETFNLQTKTPLEMQHDLWFDYVMQDYADNFVAPIDPDKFEQFIKDEEIPEDKKQEVYNELEAARKAIVQRSYVNLPKTGYERTKELENLYGFDFRPDWMKRNHYD